jgi:RimJ/RimL family protein N-acetyltransferase/catechol 2,3-dioxygenase-like lactoylglutathione lyase family enzyme
MSRALLLKTFPAPIELRTKRCLLRQFKPSDIEAWVAMNADPEVRRYFPSVLTREEAMGEAERIRGFIQQRGWGFWALEIVGKTAAGENAFAGFVGLTVTRYEAPFTPSVEIGWRLAQSAQGAGYATEAAQAAMQFAFDELDLAEVVSVTVPDNTPSQNVMLKLGMRRNPADDYDHPLVADGHKFKRHVLYRISRAEYRAQHSDDALTSVNHYQVAIPKGKLDEALAFYVGALGCTRIAKPAELSPSGAWLQAGAIELHLGEEANFVAASRAHPAFNVRDAASLKQRCDTAGYTTRDESGPNGYTRFSVFDPFGNRIELMQKLSF